MSEYAHLSNEEFIDAVSLDLALAEYGIEDETDA